MGNPLWPMDRLEWMGESKETTAEMMWSKMSAVQDLAVIEMFMLCRGEEILANFCHKSENLCQ